jgi:hypothetical protein
VRAVVQSHGGFSFALLSRVNEEIATYAVVLVLAKIVAKEAAVTARSSSSLRVGQHRRSFSQPVMLRLDRRSPRPLASPFDQRLPPFVRDQSGERKKFPKLSRQFEHPTA